jgi:hypothetical protein
MIRRHQTPRSTAHAFRVFCPSSGRDFGLGPNHNFGVQNDNIIYELHTRRKGVHKKNYNSETLNPFGTHTVVRRPNKYNDNTNTCLCVLRTRRVRPRGRRWPENPNSAPQGGAPGGRDSVIATGESRTRSFHWNIVRIILYRPAGSGLKGSDRFRTIVFFFFFFKSLRISLPIYR